MKCNLAGFIKLKVTPKNDAKLILAFDEILTEGKSDIYRLTCINTVIYYLNMALPPMFSSGSTILGILIIGKDLKNRKSRIGVFKTFAGEYNKNHQINRYGL